MKILCPTDFSENSEHAIEYAINLSNQLNAKLYFITSYKVPHIAGNLHSLGERIDSALHDDIRTFVNKFDKLITSGIQPEMDVVEGNTSVSILHYAEKNDIDLIVMGTKGSSGIANMIMGGLRQSLKAFGFSNLKSGKMTEDIFWKLSLQLRFLKRFQIFRLFKIMKLNQHVEY